MQLPFVRDMIQELKLVFSLLPPEKFIMEDGSDKVEDKAWLAPFRNLISGKVPQAVLGNHVEIESFKNGPSGCPIGI